MNSQSREEESKEDDKDEEANRLLQSQPPSPQSSLSCSLDDVEEVAFEAREKILIVDLESADSVDSNTVPPFSEFGRRSPGRSNCRVLAAMAVNVGNDYGIADSALVGQGRGRHWSPLGGALQEEYPNWAKLVLWFMAEVALIGADIQEVIGSAIAIQILSHGVLPLWAGVIITASDWYFGSQTQLKTIRQAVGVVGCVIMPHNVFLHSALVQSRNVDPNKKSRVQEALNYYSIESTVALSVSFMINLFVTTVFAKGFYGTKEAGGIGLVNAGQYLEEKYGGGLLPILYIWGIGLLAAGQSSTITGTYAGQFIMGGFLNLRLKKWMRALITRSFAIVPTIVVAVIFNTSEGSLDVLNEWLNVLQSIQIPFALIPLLTLVAKEEVMGVFKIGPVLERVAWTVAALVMVINGYLLLDFFISEVNGLKVGISVFTCTAAYVAFIIYLVSHSGALPSSWMSLLSKRIANISN
ncbi:hypothetical protein FNV43_RR11764 [Rhamnella rubrinervis]|uniref:Metal transporter Nramp2 n=1 Tax=Rhamnella rubrinervis TaxID=2594499 RepID=A0A8K0MHL5_9ROSA|nr:hypothetical protein FNV43_RR11764 [Rhamnella rubrinervis]